MQKNNHPPLFITATQQVLRNIGYQKLDENFYLVVELADELRVNPMTIYHYIHAGRLKAYKIGKDFRIDKKEFERFLESVKTSQ